MSRLLRQPDAGGKLRDILLLDKAGAPRHLALRTAARGRRVGNFTIGEAWSQAMAMVSEHFRMILIYVLAGVLIPLILQFAILGGSMATLFDPQTMMANPQDPFAVFASFGAGLFIVAIAGNIIQSASYYAAWRHALTGGTEDPASTVSWALGAAAMWFVATLVLALVIGLVIGLPLVLLIGGGAALAGNADSAGSAMAGIGLTVLLLVPLMLFLFLWLAARLSVVGPAMAEARSINPLYGLATSWRLTGPSQWSIVGYLLLMIIAYLVISAVIGLVVGIGMIGAMAAGSEPGAGAIMAAVIGGVVAGVPVAIAVVGIFGGIYRTLVPSRPGDVFA